MLLRQELGSEYDILDEQTRYTQDARLEEYLANNPGINLVDEVTEPTVR